MTDSLWDAGDGDVVDVVGARVLAGIQLIYVSRLSAHPLPMVSGGLVTIAGQGPKDSNGAGKSSLIAAVSLLSGDEQWRWSSGASDAADLLFTAEIAAQDSQWGNADHGYVIGVFTDPRAETSQDLTASALTVWLRINRRAPYIDLRWQHGLYVPAGGSDSDRVAAADGMWETMQRRNGRHDLHANRLNQTLYGRHVRCVSFLSTSVRASTTANLLAQPLNELTPERIFDAIAALTGIDRDMEAEQKSRTTVHERREAEKRAKAELERWEHETAAVVEGIRQRADSRALMERTRSLWHGRCARLVVDGRDRLQQISAQIRALTCEWDERDGKLDQIRGDLDELQNDDTFRESCAATDQQWQQISKQNEGLSVQLQMRNQRIEEASKQRISLLEEARAADGRTREQAEAEEHAADDGVEKAVEAAALRRKELKDARDALAEAEQGDDLAGEQLKSLRDAGIHAAALLDSVILRPEQRPIWEPRLFPYREAVVVADSDVDRARELLDGMPGTMLIPATASPATSPAAGQPEAADERLQMGRFLAALADRATPQGGIVDSATGVVVVGGFTAPLTGRATRIEQARSKAEAAEEPARRSGTELESAKRVLKAARRRTAAVSAAEEAERLQLQIAALREQADELSAQQETLAPLVEQVRVAYSKMLASRETRQQQIQQLRTTRNQLDRLQDDNTTQAAALAAEQTALDLEARISAFGGTPDEAATHLLALEGEQAAWSTQEWTLESCAVLDTALSGCFPRGVPDEQIPHEIGELRRDPRWNRGATTRGELFPALQRALRTYLAQTEQEDGYQLSRIEEQRIGRTADLAEANKGLREEALADAAHRASVAAGIKDKLKKVSDQFDRLDLAYGGYGAALDYPEPEPPTEPDRPWRWGVTPKWRRAEGQRMSPYRLRGNTAQMDEKAVKLVCAAALAGGADRPLLLILDELGRNLGKQHRHEAVALFEQIGRDRNITVIGALQDDMERYAIDASGLYIKLRRRSDASPYNDAPVVIGHDDNTERVALLQRWLSGYYSPAPADDVGDDVGDDESNDDDLKGEFEFEEAR